MKPEITKNLKSSEFTQYYFLKEELKDFCRKEGLKVSGSKNELEQRIIHYLDTGKELNNVKPKKANPHSSHKISLDSKIGENFKCSESHRQFFEDEIGPTFKFKVQFQKWLKSNPDKTYEDAIKAYNTISNSKEKSEIGKQFQYNQYIRDFFKDNENKTLKDAVTCWNYKKSLKGQHKYEKSDLKILKR